MMGRLWRGELPLAEAFWTHAILGVAVANMTATAVALLLLAAGLHPVAAVVAWLSPAPYVLVAVIGVWRSADRARTSPAVVTLARWTAVLWGVVMAIL